MYFTLVIFSILGYVLLKYHHRLGFQVSVPIEELFSSYNPPPKVHPLLKDIEVLLKENKSLDALQRLQGRIHDNPKELLLQSRYHKLLFINKKFEIMLESAPSLLRSLIKNKNLTLAIDVYQQSLQADKKFMLSDHTLYLPLAETMLQTGQHKMVVHLLKGFHQRFPQSPSIPEVYFILSKALSEGLSQDTQALSILTYLLKTYPNSPIYSNILSYKKTLDQIIEAQKC